MRECPTSAVLLDFLEEELPQTVDEQVVSHLRRCPGCQAVVDQLVDDLELRELEHNARRRERVRLPALATTTLRQSLYALGPLVGGARGPGRSGFGTGFLTGAPLGSPDPNDPGAGSPDYATGDEGQAAARLGSSSDAYPRFRAPWQLQLPIGGSAESTDRLGRHADRQVGRFRLRSRLGAGSCGVVYLADDTLLKRQVALKLPRVPSLVDPELGKRFVREAQATASLHHPNIVPVYEAGQTDELCYLTTAYCAGPTLAEWLHERNEPVPADTAARIVRDLADAVAHAHQHGILHRDIKPANVLLDPAPGGELPFTPKLSDFGLARLLESDRTATASGVILGTPRYMAPEQANGQRALCGPPTDVYSLGAILYELLCGRPPVEGNDSAETLLRLVLVDPVPLRRLNPRVPPDLEAISRKCLERDPGRRYATASDLAADLRRFLSHVPTQARPQGWTERVVRSARRNPQIAIPCVAALLVAVLLTSATAWHNARLQSANRELDSALAEAGRANERSERSAREAAANAATAAQLLYVSDLKLAGKAWSAGDPRTARNLLLRHRPGAGEVDQRGFEWHYLWNLGQVPGQTLHSGRQAIYHLCRSPDGRYLAAGGQGALVRVYDAASQQELSVFATRQIEVNGLTFGPDGETLLTAGDDGTLRFWDWAAGTEKWRIEAHPEKAYRALIVPNQSLIASCGDEPVIRLWDLGTGESQGILEGHQRAVEAIALSPDGRTLASAASDRTVRFWDLSSRREVRTFRGHEGRLTSLAFSPDGRLMATGCLDQTARLWDTTSGELLHTERFLDAVQSVAFSRDGRQLVAGDRAGAIHVHRVPDRLIANGSALERLHIWSAHQGRVYSVAAADDQGVLSAGEDGELHWWSPPPPANQAVPIEDGPATDIAFLPGSHRLIVSTEAKLHLWDATTGRVNSLSNPAVHGWISLAASPRGDFVAAGSREGVVCMWDVSTGDVRTSWRAGEECPIDRLGFHPDGTQLAIVSQTCDEAVRVFDVPAGTQRTIIPGVGCHAICFSPDRSHLAFAANDDVVLWDLRRDVAVSRLGGHESTVNAIVFSPDGDGLVSVGRDRRTILWDVLSGETADSLRGHQSGVYSAAFSADGHSLVSGDDGGVLKVWHCATRQELLELPKQASGCRRIVLSDDGAYLACLLDSGRITVFCTRRGASPSFSADAP